MEIFSFMVVSILVLVDVAFDPYTPRIGAYTTSTHVSILVLVDVAFDQYHTRDRSRTCLGFQSLF